MRSPLFRAQALEAQQDHRFGGVLRVRSPATALLTIIAVLVAAVILCFGLWGQYTRKEHVAGYLAPTRGLIKVFTPQAGTILEKRVAEGQAVKQGEVLLVISSERSTTTMKDTQAAMLRELGERRDSLEQEKLKQAEIDSLAADDLAQRIAGFEAELKQAQVQAELQRSLVTDAERTIKRHEALVATHFVSEATLQQTQENLLEKRSQLANLQRMMTGLTRDLGSARMELASSSLKRANHAAAIERQMSELEQRITEADTLRTIALTAPADGTVTTILAEVGQTANLGTLLLSILPEGAELEAQLLVPTHAVGFIKPGQGVALRYPAFPYQRFGHYLGEVVTIGRTVIQPNESNLPLTLQEPVYRVTVRLPAQQVSAYGQALSLQAGMMVDADIWVDRRRVLEWLFDPILSVTGRL